MLIHHIGQLYAETLLTVALAIVLALIVDIFIPAPQPTEPRWKSWLLILIQLFVDVTIIFFILYFANRIGLLDQATIVGVAALIVIVTIFFLMQVQIGRRVEMIYNRRTIRIERWYESSRLRKLLQRRQPNPPSVGVTL